MSRRPYGAPVMRGGRSSLGQRLLLVTSLAGVLLIALAAPTASAASGATTGRGRAAATARPHTSTFATPAWHLGGLGSIWTSSPVTATIDGVKAVVQASQSGEIYVVNAKNGQELPGWPQYVHIHSSTPTAVDSSPAVAYLDGPNSPPSIIVGAGSLWKKDQEGGVEAFRANGSVRFVYQTKATFNPWGSPEHGISDPVFATPAVGDITGKGQLDVVFGSYDHYLYALQPNGHLVAGFPVQRADTIWSSPALVDTSHTGRDDIIEGGDSSGYDGCFGGWVTDYRYARVAPVLIWQRCLPESVWSSPTVGMINSSGRAAVVVGTSWNYQQLSYWNSPASREVFAFYADNGATVPGWPVKTPENGPTFGSPAIGKVDGQLAIVSTSCAHCDLGSPASAPANGPATVTAWSGSGRRLWSFGYMATNEAIASPALVDLTGGADAGNDVLVGNAGGEYLVNGRTGHYLYTSGTGWNSLDPACDVAGTPAAAYVPGGPGNGWMLFVACGGPQTAGSLTAYAFPHAPSAANPPAWPEWRANADRTGIADPVSGTRVSCPPTKVVPGYRLATTNGAVFDHGKLRYCGGANQLVLPSPIVSMATRPGGGYWLLLADGTVYNFGNAAWYGDLRGSAFAGGPQPPGAPVVGIAATADGQGYYVASANGNVYAFGDAHFRGSKGGHAINGAIAGIAVDRSTGGYWLVTAKGSVYAYGAPDHGGEPTHLLAAPIVGITSTPNGNGYWLVGARGSVYQFGLAHFYGSAAASHPSTPVVGLGANTAGTGYWVATSGGTVYHFGAAANLGSSNAGSGEPVQAFSTPPPA